MLFGEEGAGNHGVSSEEIARRAGVGDRLFAVFEQVRDNLR
ncbi:hypothetical protein A33K_13001 [Burkholderia humptydooensis MSMB43]|uniref:Uncharacterized protein n=1 Tax=Burkholderia humptydooensis MSMB43 TaxID=441157 RepID=A0ABN0GB84_9BURK|nr:hypothetical protein A33K_13001 [Burkholderia humptydooensis MSMB43]